MGVIMGTQSNDLLDGTGGGDQILGKGGNDILNGLAGDDRIFGGFGDDELYGGLGDDVLSGGMGDDLLSGGDGNDDLLGGLGDDTLIGGSGNDSLDGGLGWDVAVFSDSVRNYDVSFGRGRWTIAHTRGTGADGTDEVRRVEELRFADGTIYLDGRNNAPIAADDAAAVDEDGPAIVIAVLANDWDFEGDPLTVTGLDATGTVGALTLNPDGTVTYDPAGRFGALGAGEQATDTFSYTVSDGHGHSDTATVTVTITGENDAPVVTVVDPPADTEGDAGTPDVVSFDLFADLTTASDVDRTDTPAFDDNVVVVAAAGSATTDTSLLTVAGSMVSYDRADFDVLNAGESAIFEISFDVTSGPDTVTRTVTLTIAGEDDGPAPQVPQVIDLTGLAPPQGFIIQGDAAGDQVGWSVSGAGDVNGDGFDDVIIGAPFGDDGGDRAGEAYVVFGKAAGFGTIDLTGLAPPDGFIIQGDAAGDRAGWSVSAAGDVNGDGFDDLIVGARFGDDGGTDAGEAYVVFGKASGFGTLDLSSLAPADGFIIQGDAAGDWAGYSVSAAGDVNGDGFDDLIVGAITGDDGGINAGEAYVVFGKASGFGTIDLTGLAPPDGFLIQGDAADDRAGWSVSSAGDVNGDGFDDLIVGAFRGDDGGEEAGEAYVVFGKASGFGTIDLTGLAPPDGFIIQGDAAGDFAGWSVSSAGDVNGDGFDDLIVGAPGGDDGGNLAGEAYVVFGKASGFGTIDLTDLSAADGFVIQGDAAGDFAGRSVSAAGDVNGDGFDDLIVGAFRGDDGGTDAGEAYVVFGKASGIGTIDLSGLTAADGFIIQGDAAGDRAGFSVSAAGDVNGDGFDDLIVGAFLGDDGGFYAGEAYVVFGGAFGGSATPVVTAGTAAAEILIGGLGDDSLDGGGGADVIRSGAGDDLLSVADTGFARIDGGTGFDTLALAGGGMVLDLTQILPAVISSIETIDLAGTGANSLKLSQLDVFDLTEERSGGRAILRVTGDADDTVTFTDVAWVNAGSVTEGATTFDRYSLGNAEVRIEQGVSVGFPLVIDLTGLAPPQGFIIQGDSAGDWAGHSVSSAGDVNGDGFDDLIVGATFGDDGGTNAGEAYVVFGKSAGFGTIDLSGLAPPDGFVIQGDAAGDQAGYSVSAAGDVNGDGFDDLIVGAFRGDDGGDRAGEAYVVFGKASGLGTIDLSSLTAANGFVIRGDAARDYAGVSVSSAGDVNGDGFDDLIVGAPGAGSAGAAYVVFGKASGFGTIDLSGLSAADGFIIQGDAAGDFAGRSVSSAGDVNGDGFDDLIVGAPRGDDGGYNAGEAYVVFGKSAGFGTIDLSGLTAADGFVIQGDAANDQAGYRGSAAGDVNGDGFDDLIVGAPFGDDGGSDAGAAYVVFGKASGFGTIDLTGLAPADGFVIEGDAAGDWAGYSVSAAGDVNGDGFDDLIVGARLGDDGGSNAGEAYVLFGKASGFGTIDLSDFTAADGFVIQGDAAGDQAAWSVSAAGDVNGDGFDDLIAGAPFGDDGGTDAGEAYVVFGGAFGGSATPVVTAGTAAAEILIGGLGNDSLDGGGGADVIRSGAGDDVLSVADTGFARIDGGTGFDTLALDGSDLLLDFTAIDSSSKVTGIEAFDLGGSGPNTLRLNTQDLLQLSDETNDLFVYGDADDTVDVSAGDFAAAGTESVGGEEFNVFESASTQARLLADQDLTVLV